MAKPSPPSLEAYNLTTHQITGSTQISRKTSLIVSQLRSPQAAGENKATIIVLTAKARYANKLISVVEIAKRELAANDGGAGKSCFQYNAVGSVMVEVEREGNAEARGDEDDDDAEEDAFESMDAPLKLDGKKKRAVPVLTVYLSGVSVKELKMAYGEQR